MTDTAIQQVTVQRDGDEWTAECAQCGEVAQKPVRDDAELGAARHIARRHMAADRCTPQEQQYAAGKLRKLDDRHTIQPFQAGDEELLCANDSVPIVATRGQGYVHDPAAIRRLRAAAGDGQWPR